MYRWLGFRGGTPMVERAAGEEMVTHHLVHQYKTHHRQEGYEQELFKSKPRWLVSLLIRRFPIRHLSHLLRKPVIYRCQG